MKKMSTPDAYTKYMSLWASGTIFYISLNLGKLSTKNGKVKNKQETKKLRI